MSIFMSSELHVGFKSVDRHSCKKAGSSDGESGSLRSNTILSLSSVTNQPSRDTLPIVTCLTGRCG